MIYITEENRNRDNSAGLFCKNLFLKDRKGQFYLVVIPHDKKVDLKRLKCVVDAARNLSFGSDKELWDCLGMVAGGVSPLGLINDQTYHKVHVVIDNVLTCNSRDIMLNFHPFYKALTLLMSYKELQKYIVHCGHQVTYIDV